MKCYKEYKDKDNELIKYIEKEFINFADNYKVHEWQIPALIGGDILRKCGYFKTMPNQLTAVGYINPDSISDVIARDEVNEKEIINRNFYLTPAACIHIYPMLKKENLCNEIITTKARVYRYENAKFETGKRLWDFGVREFVAVGNSEFIKKFLEEFQQKSLEFSKLCGIECMINESNDHFYPTKNNKTIEKIQKNNGLKKELICVSDGLAIASYNYHGYHFSKTFGFDKEGKIVTGCVGFGLDRWVSAINNKEQ